MDKWPLYQEDGECLVCGGQARVSYYGIEDYRTMIRICQKDGCGALLQYRFLQEEPYQDAVLRTKCRELLDKIDHEEMTKSEERGAGAESETDHQLQESCDGS
jgi:hypothetical protein